MNFEILLILKYNLLSHVAAPQKLLSMVRADSINLKSSQFCYNQVGVLDELRFHSPYLDRGLGNLGLVGWKPGGGNRGWKWYGRSNEDAGGKGLTIVDEEVVAQEVCGNNTKQGDGNEVGDNKGKKAMEIEEGIMDRTDLMEIRQIAGGRYDLRRRTGAMWKRTVPSLNRLSSATKVPGEKIRAVPLKRSRELVIYEGGQQADDAGSEKRQKGNCGAQLVRQILGNEFCIQVEIKGEGISD
ncbi:sphingomyelin phosphodiesterase 4 [Striga asiatica]|uniref:Sphingomyelin phosphodiesterase 4 n=1 Tax=Striga asiatica TaxID=4170 RepID=A0A5A7QX04_STRAF|nr:sphingomyelin phosphodiesterase 4 [Striga asiatica]